MTGERSLPTRKTVKGIASVEGMGLHTGERATVRIGPAPAGFGLRFRAGRARDRVEIPADLDYVVDSQRRIVLGRDGVTVQTVEHLLGVCAGLGLTDAVAEVDGPEIPAGDGSGLMIARALLEAGLKDLDSPAPFITVRGEVQVNDGDRWIRFRPSDRLVIRYVFARPGHPVVGRQEFSFAAGDDFLKEIAPARTFGFIEEVKALWDQGLGLGGNLQNALIIGTEGYLTEPRFAEELARHKILDLMGDLTLLGARLVGTIEGFKSGHSLHLRLCQTIRSMVAQEAEG